MNRRILLILASLVLLGLLVAGLLIATDSPSQDRESLERLVDLTLERQVQAAQQIVDVSCTCADERGDESPECADPTLLADNELEDTKACMIDAAADLEADVPPGLEDFLSCLEAHFQEVDDCLQRLSDDNPCSADASLQMVECSVALQLHQCGDTDDATHQWLERFVSRIEDQGCHTELLANLQGPAFEAPPTDLNVEPHRAMIQINDTAISLDGHSVIDLSRGQLGDHHPPSIDDGLDALADALDDLGDVDELSLHASALIPYETITHVLYTAHAHSNLPLYTDIATSPPESQTFDRKDTFHDAPEPEAQRDPKVTPLSIVVGDEGFMLRGLDTPIDPLDGCDDSPWTICLTQGDTDPMDLFERARSATADGDHAQAAKYYEQALEHYDFRRLYNLANRLHDDHPHPGLLRLSAARDIPIGLVKLTGQVVAYRLAKSHYDDPDNFWTDIQRGPATAELFSEPMFSVVY